MFRNLKCKNTALCELSVTFVPLLILTAGIIAFVLIRDDAISSGILVVSMIAALIPLVRNAILVFSLDFTLTSLRNWQKDRLSFETDINGVGAHEVEKAITERGLKWGVKKENRNGAVLTLYKKTKTLNDIIKIVHQNVIVYSMQTLNYDDYKAKLDEVKKQVTNLDKDSEDTVIAVLFLCDRADLAVLNSVRDDCDFIDGEKGVILPVVYDALTRQYYLDAFYEYNFIVKSTKNYLLDSIKRIVFGGKFPLENNDRFDYSNEISIWQDKTLGELIDNIKEEEKKDKQFIKNTAEQLSDGQTLLCDDVLYIKHNGKLMTFDVDTSEEKPDEVCLWTMESWNYPVESEISKKDMAVLEEIATDYFEKQGKKVFFDLDEV